MRFTNKRSIAIRGALAGTLVAGSLGVTLIQTSSAAPQRKNYTSTATPTSISRGVYRPIAVTLTNLQNSNASFNGIRLTVPSVFEMGSTSVSRGTFTVSGQIIEVINADVAPGTSVTITQVVRAACNAPASSPSWTTDVRQANDFNGALNKFLVNGTEASVSISNPCNGSIVTCTAGDTQLCQTGNFDSPAGNVANIIVNDSDTVSGTLSGQFTGVTVQCDEYTSTSERLQFNMVVTNGASTTGLTKTLRITQATQAGKLTLADYYACFQAPYDFPAQLPSQLAADFNSWNFSGNTQPVGSEFKGLLLPCEALQQAPCVQSKAFTAGSTITMELRVPLGDPAVSF